MSSISRRALFRAAAAALLPPRAARAQTRILMNLPHIAIGGFAAFAGFVLARVWSSPVYAVR